MMARSDYLLWRTFAPFGLNIFYSGIKYTEKDWVRHKVQHYPLQCSILLPVVKKICVFVVYFGLNIFYLRIQLLELRSTF